MKNYLCTQKSCIVWCKIEIVLLNLEPRILAQSFSIVLNYQNLNIRSGRLLKKQHLVSWLQGTALLLFEPVF